MGAVRNIYDAWETAKGVCLCLVLSLAAGWLSRGLLTGKVDSVDRVAGYILDLTLLVMLSVLSILGARRWRDNRLTPAAKRLLVLSIAFLILFFVMGWNSDISLR